MSLRSIAAASELVPERSSASILRLEEVKAFMQQCCPPLWPQCVYMTRTSHRPLHAAAQGAVTAALFGGAALLAAVLVRRRLGGGLGRSGLRRQPHAERTASRKRSDRPGCVPPRVAPAALPACATRGHLCPTACVYAARQQA